MNRVYSVTRKTVTIFLAIVLVTGTIIAVFYPSSHSSLSIQTALALSEYGEDNVKCNNFNLNINGLNVNIDAIPEFLRDLLITTNSDQAHQAEIGFGGTDIGSTSTYGNNEKRFGYDNDDKKDFAFICINNNENEQPSTPTPPTPPTPPPISENLDLAVANLDDSDVSILLGNGDGTFVDTPAAPTYDVGDLPLSVAVGLFNDDGFLDLAVANRDNDAGNDDVSILLGNGDGTFVTPAPTYGVGDAPSSVAVGLFNDDGFLDLAVANSADDNVSILIGNGDGTFVDTPAPTYGVGDAPSSVAVGDFN